MTSLQGALSRGFRVDRPISVNLAANIFNYSRPISIRVLIDLLPPAWTSGGTTKNLAVHAALIPPASGYILFFGGTEYNTDNLANHRIKQTSLYDCGTLNHQLLESPETDTFCCGHSLIEGCRLVVAGGTSPEPFVGGPHAGHWIGIRDTSIFDPINRIWITAAMTNLEPRTTNPSLDSGGRWYPTLLTLADGRVLAMSGHPGKGDSRHTNNSPEIFSPDQNFWGHYNDLGDGGIESRFEVQYPRLHLLPNGEIFCVTPLFENQPFSLIYNWQTQEFRFVGGLIPALDYLGWYIVDGHDTTSVLLPLLISDNYKPRILLCGSNQAFLIDLGADTPTWRGTNPRTIEGSPARYNLSAVLLPTGDVFICGGVSSTDKKDTYIRPELYLVERDEWETLEEDPEHVVRNYHSVALLMPDGRVWTAGSNKDGNPSSDTKDTHEPRIQIYEPWYYLLPRPRITYFPARINYKHVSNDEFSYQVFTPQAAAISRVAIMRVGSATHAFNPDQRYVELAFRYLGGNELQVSPPMSGGLAPPGYYLLFILDKQGIPSRGVFVSVG